jgi:hypothetical protein
MGISQRSRVQNGVHAVNFQAMKKSRRQSQPGLKSSQKNFFSWGIKSLQQKWAKCIELLGDCIEK